MAAYEPLRRATAGLGAAFKRRPWLVFLAAGVAFLGFALLSLNLVHLLSANLNLIAEHGTEALADGAARQLIELLLSGYGALACYFAFKFCERVIVDWLNRFE
ncbi:MAG TPA: hypothetical protein VMK32_05175 [Burkholderiaceae bacterium]|nr:hypothetical protein [Burkholderiaceae bacterium]